MLYTKIFIQTFVVITLFSSFCFAKETAKSKQKRRTDVLYSPSAGQFEFGLFTELPMGDVTYTKSI